MLQARRRIDPVYPESDGKPVADNSVQLNWIHRLCGNLLILFRERADVFVGSDLLWYPVEGHPEVSTAPNAFAVFGRPKGDRGSYLEWREAGVPMTVVFEVRSRGNTKRELDEKVDFYDEYGVEEYYLIDPDRHKVTVHRRGRDGFPRVYGDRRLVSPRLGIRFAVAAREIEVFHPNGRPFLRSDELDAERLRERQRADAAEADRLRERQRADAADADRLRERQRADAAEAGNAELRAKNAELRAAADAEIARLRRLLDQAGRPEGQS